MGNIKNTGGTAPLPHQLSTTKTGQAKQAKMKTASDSAKAEAKSQKETSAAPNTKNTVKVNTGATVSKGFGNEAGLTMEIAKELPKIGKEDTDKAVDFAMELIEEFYPDKADVAFKRLGNEDAQAELKEIMNLLPGKEALSEFKKGIKHLTKGPGC